MANYKVEVVPVEKSILGEGPHWDAGKQELYYVDLMGKEVRRYNPQTGEHYILKIDDAGCLGAAAVGVVIPCAGNPNEFVIAHGRSLKRVEWDLVSQTPTKLTTIYEAEDNNLNGRFNDGKCDSVGRLWVGSMALLEENLPPPEDLTKGLLYKLDVDGKVTKHVRNIAISNGLAWSRDNKTFYYVDSYTRRVDAFDYDVNAGAISNRRTAFDFAQEDVTGLPDGIAIDSNGNLWVACYSGSQVINVNPKEGKLINAISFPTRDITSVTFGGQNLDVLYVTSSKYHLNSEELAAQPEAGSLFKVTNIGVTGLSAGIAFGGNI